VAKDKDQPSTKPTNERQLTADEWREVQKQEEERRKERKTIDRYHAIRDNLIPPPYMKEPRRSPKATQHQRLVELMQELQLEPGKLPREVRKDIRKPYKDKYHDEPSPSAVTRAYKAYCDSTG
jgi:hypothetical protein